MSLDEEGQDEGYPKAENIKVVVRIRPMQKHEAGDTACIRASADGSEVHIKLDKSSDIIDNYACARCFTRETSQEKFFQECDIVSLLDSALAGYRSCAFAFGQTGAGKTYTMLGPPDKPVDGEGSDGLLGRSLVYIFGKLKSRNVTFRVKISCLEVYHEHVYDLFSKEARTESSTFGSSKVTSLHIREHSDFGYYAEGCHIVSCNTLEDALSAIETAMKNRQIGGHDLNSRSNRSHCITDIYIDTSESDQANKHIIQSMIKDTQRASLKNIKSMHGGAYELADKTSGGDIDNGEKLISESSSITQSFLLCGRMTLVDLAGSERLKSTNSLGTKMINEAGFINRSLYVLGKVITGLAKTKMREQAQGDISSFSTINPRDVPFRESKLTKLLLGGILGGLCMMVCCVSESTKSVYESKRTLMFGMSCARIKNRPTKLLDPQIRLILDLKDEVKRLRQENMRLRDERKGVVVDSTFGLTRPSDDENQHKHHHESITSSSASAPTRRPLSAGLRSHVTGKEAHTQGDVTVVQYSQSTKHISNSNSSNEMHAIDSHSHNYSTSNGSSRNHNHHQQLSRISPQSGDSKLPSVLKDKKRNIVSDNKKAVDALGLPPRGTDMRSERGLPLIPVKLSKPYSDPDSVPNSAKDRDSFDYYDGTDGRPQGGAAPVQTSKSLKPKRRSVMTDSKMSLLKRQLEKIEAMEREREKNRVNVIEATVVNNMVVKSPAKAGSQGDGDDVSLSTNATSGPARTDAIERKRAKRQQVLADITTAQNNKSPIANSPFISHLLNEEKHKPKPIKKQSDSNKGTNKSNKKDMEKIAAKLNRIEAAVSQAETLMEDDPSHATVENEEVVAAMKIAIKEMKKEVNSGADGNYDDDGFDNAYDDGEFEAEDATEVNAKDSASKKNTAEAPVVKNGLLEDDDGDTHDEASREASGYFREQLLAKYGNKKIDDAKDKQIAIDQGKNAENAMHKKKSADHHSSDQSTGDKPVLRKPNAKTAVSQPIKPKDGNVSTAIFSSEEKKKHDLDTEIRKKAAAEMTEKEKAAKLEIDNKEAERIKFESEKAEKDKVALEAMKREEAERLKFENNVKSKSPYQDDGDAEYGDYGDDDDFENDNEKENTDNVDNADSYKIGTYKIDLESVGKKKSSLNSAMIEADKKIQAEIEEQNKKLVELDIAENKRKAGIEAERKRKEENDAKQRRNEQEKKEAVEAENVRENAEKAERERLEKIETDRIASGRVELELKKKEAIDAENAKNLGPTQSFYKRQADVAAFLDGDLDDLGSRPSTISEGRNIHHLAHNHNHIHNHNHNKSVVEELAGGNKSINSQKDDDYGEDEFYNEDDFEDD